MRLDYILIDFKLLVNNSFLGPKKEYRWDSVDAGNPCWKQAF